MQLLDSRFSSPLNSGSNQLQLALEDIVNQVEINSDFSIRHRDYQPLELPEETKQNFQNLPVNLQAKYFSQLLQNFLYGIYYNGSLKKSLALDTDLKQSNLYQDLENNTFLGVDVEFYDNLHRSNQGQGYFDPGWQIVGIKDNGKLAVHKDGLTLQIDRQFHLNPPEQQAEVGDKVAIRLPKNRVQNGFYMAIADEGARQDNPPEQNNIIVRIYFNLTAEGAIAVMSSLTEQLNQLKIPFSFKALYNPSDYQRHDSAVLYFDRSNYQVIKKVLEAVYSQNQTHFRSHVPLFTKYLAPGLALAEEPNHKFSSKDSFGTHRCQIIANALLAAKESGNNTPTDRMAAIVEQFEQLGLELERAYLNADSQDIYTPLEI